MLEPWVAQSVLLPRYSSQLIRTQMWDHLVHHLPPYLPGPQPCCASSPLLPISAAPPTSLDECFFFNSLVVRPSYSSIFWQFWLLFVFKLIAVLLLLLRGSEAYLPMPPSWLEVYFYFLYLELELIFMNGMRLDFILINIFQIYDCPKIIYWLLTDFT